MGISLGAASFLVPIDSGKSTADSLLEASDKQKEAAKKAEQDAKDLVTDIESVNSQTLSAQESLEIDADRKNSILRKRNISGSGRRRSILGGLDNAIANNPNAVSGS